MIRFHNSSRYAGSSDNEFISSRYINSYKASGFTLIEMIIVIALIGIIASIAAPSFQQQIAKRQVENTINQFATCFKESRIRAKTSRSDVTVTLNSAGNELNCGNQGVVQINDGISVNVNNQSIIFKANGMVFDSTKNPIGDTNYQFCKNGLSNSVDLVINSKGRIVVNKPGGKSC